MPLHPIMSKKLLMSSANGKLWDLDFSIIFQCQRITYGLWLCPEWFMC